MANLDQNPSETPRILVVDDDTRLRSLLDKYLTKNNFLVDVAKDASQARERLAGSESYAAMVLDVMMPGETGLELAESLRTYSNMPILMLTARGEVDDRIEGLEKGADDYLSKPFEPRELVLRLQKLVARGKSYVPVPVDTKTVAFGPYRFDIATQRLTNKGVLVHLTSGEANLMQALAENFNAALSREALSERLSVPASERTIDVQITRLRKKIEIDPRHPVYIQTIRHQGYILRPE